MAQRGPITTHILDTTAGTPASSVSVSLHILSNKRSNTSASGAFIDDLQWSLIKTSVTGW